MFKRKPKGIYRQLLKDAWRIVWERKSLWVFGIFAGVVSTGGVFETGLRAFDRVSASRDILAQLLAGSFMGYESFREYVRWFSLMEPWRQQVLLTIFILVGLLVLVFGVRSQSLLVLQAGGKKTQTWSTLLHRSEHFFWRVLTIDLVTKALTVVLVMATTLPLVLYLTEPTLLYGVFYVATFVLFFPCLIAVNLLSLLSIVDVVERDHHPLPAAEKAIGLFRRHWVVMLELGLMTFLVSLAVIAFSLVGVAVLFVATMMLLVTSVFLGSGGLYIGSAVIGALLMIILFIVANGLMTAFQYTVWLLYYRQAQKREGIQAKLHRWWKNS